MSQPFQQTVGVSFSGGGTANAANLVTVPPGKRLIVKFASFNAQVPSGEKILAGRLVLRNSALVHELIAYFAGANSSGNQIFIGSGPVLLYVESGETLQAGLLKATSSANSSFGNFTVSGYFVAVP